MKRLLALLLSLLILLTFCACATESDRDDRDDDDRKSSDTSDLDDIFDNDENDKTDREDDDKYDADEDEDYDYDDDDDDDSSKTTISRGKVSGKVYKSEYSGLKFTAPSGWVYYTDEQMAELVDLSLNTFLGMSYEELMENTPSIYDMMVVDSKTNSNVNIGYENIAKTLGLNGSAEDYIEAVLSNLESVTAFGYEQESEIEKVKLGKEKFYRVVVSASYNGVDMMQAFYARKIDEYMLFVSITCTDGYDIEDIEDMFS